MKKDDIMTQLRIGLLRSAVLAAAMALAAGNTGVAAAGDVLVKSGDKIVFLGDSITCAGNLPGGYITLTALGLKANGIDVKAINAGIGGNRSREMLARLDRDVLSQKPNWMTLSCGVNDKYGVPLDEFKSNVTKIVERAEAAHVKVMVLTANCGDEIYSECLREVAAEKKCVLADLRIPYRQAAEANPSARLANDWVHPNARGYFVMAKSVLRAFGLDEAQMAKAEKALLDQPDTFEFSPEFKIGVSLRQMKALDEIALKRKMRTDEMLRLLFVADLLPGVSTKTQAEIEAYLDAQKGNDPWAASREKMKQRLDALLSR